MHIFSTDYTEFWTVRIILILVIVIFIILVYFNYKKKQEIIKCNNKIQQINENLEVQKKQLAQTLHSREHIQNMYYLISNNVNDIIWTSNDNKTISYISPSVTRILGYLPESLIGKPFNYVLTEKSKKIVTKKLEKNAFSKGRIKPVIIEMEKVHKDGTIIWFEEVVSPILDNEKQYVGFLGAAREITKRKDYQKKLVTREKYLDILVVIKKYLMSHKNTENYYDKVLKLLGEVSNASRVYIYKNFVKENQKVFVKLQAKWISENLDNDKTYIFDKIEYESGLLRWYKKLLDGKYIKSYMSELGELEYNIVKKYNILSFLIIPIIVNKKLWGFIGFDDCEKRKKWNRTEINMLLSAANSISIFKEKRIAQEALHELNLTLEKRVEKRTIELQKAKEKAEESTRLKSSFLANLSHEVRTPINAINGFTDLLNNDDIDTETKAGFAQIVSENSTKLLNIIDDIVNISKIEASKVKIIKTECYVNEILNRLFSQSLLELKAKNKAHINLIYKTKLNDSEAKIYTDCEKLFQILNKIMNNSIKFTENGYIEYGYTITKNDKNQDYLEFFVKDSGIGVSEDKKSVIFEQFIQEDGTPSRRYGGTGLGLSIAKGLVNILEGDIWMKSDKNKGTEIYFTIPYKTKL